MTRAAVVLLVVVVSVAAAGVRLEARLEPVPASAGSAPRGAAVFLVRDDATVDWEVRVAGLSGPATATWVRAVTPAGAGPGFVLTAPPSTGSHVGSLGPLTGAEREALVGGTMQVEVATAARPDGELRGRLRPVRVDGVTCDCAASTTARFRACVRAAVRRLPASRRRSTAVRAVVRAARRARCGTVAPPRRPAATACCLAATPEENLVVEQLCAVATRRVCARAAGAVAASCDRCAAAP